jgi:hypothetical protein
MPLVPGIGVVGIVRKRAIAALFVDTEPNNCRLQERKTKASF